MWNSSERHELKDKSTPHNLKTKFHWIRWKGKTVNKATIKEMRFKNKEKQGPSDSFVQLQYNLWLKKKKINKKHLFFSLSLAIDLNQRQSN